MVLIWKVLVMLSRSSWEGDFSGVRTPGRMSARCKWDGPEVSELGGKRFWHFDAASAMLVSSMGRNENVSQCIDALRLFI